MNTEKEHLDTLTEIRSLMEKSSRFISLSGASGISAGVIAILGALVASLFQGYGFWEKAQVSRIYTMDGEELLSGGLPFTFYLIEAIIVLVFAIGASVFFTARKARKNNLPVWDNTAKRLIISLAIPLLAGGLFCVILFSKGINSVIAPSMLIFYGLALINASKYAIGDIQLLGIAEIILGLIAMFFVGYGMLFWTIGFGVFHILYGSYMHMKYERADS